MLRTKAGSILVVKGGAEGWLSAFTVISQFILETTCHIHTEDPIEL